MKPGEASPSSAQLVKLTDELYDILDSQAKYDASVIDARIAEYVFFPLSYIFRQKEQLPARLIENAVKCIRILIQDGWGAAISKELSQQLLILLTFIVGGVPGEEEKRDFPEETIREGYRTLTALIKAAAGGPGSSSPLVEVSVVPTLAHSVTVILDGITSGATPDIQLEALNAAHALYTTLRDHEALASFFPGTVSSLSRALSPPASLKSQRRILLKGLQVLKDVLVTVVGDLPTRNIKRQEKDAKVKDAGSGKMLTPAWLEATASQIQIALSSVLKLRNHESQDVQQGVERLCICLLDECHTSLERCNAILVESAIVASQPDADEPPPGLHQIDASATFQGLTRDTTLEDLANIYPELGDTVKAVVYGWIASLPRTLQLSDEEVKQVAVGNLFKGLKLVRALGIDSTTLEDSLAIALRDGVVTLMVNSKTPKVTNQDDLDQAPSHHSALVRPDVQLQQFRPVMLAQESQKGIREKMTTLVRNLGSSAQLSKLASEMLSYMRDSTGIDQLSSYWLSFELLKAALAKSSELDSFLDFTSHGNDPDELESSMQELYSFSVSTLAAHSDTTEADWRLAAISLEVAAFTASRMGESFRPELIDVLYPITTFLGSPNGQLRSHAIAALNCMAGFCGYGSVSDLIIDNVDYMVNSVSLRLNTFDISPSSTQVLKMMIRLSGPSLLPFLDDVVAAIFAALENYHGYPMFVASLFSVLTEVVEQGAKSDALLLQDGEAKNVSHQKKPPEVTTTEDIVEVIRERKEKRKRAQEEAEIEEVIEPHPKRPWKSEADELLRRREKEATGNDDDDDDDGDDESDHRGDPSSNAEVDRRDIPKTPTYDLLARITTLTQHYLTSPTPTLRKSLLDLLATVAPALAPDEDAFLPLVNSVWPVVVARLHDAEPYVVIAACRALEALCAAAGDFLASRIKTEWWNGLGKWAARIKLEAARRGGRTGTSSSGGAGNHPIGPIRDKSGPQGLHSTALGGEAGGILIPIRSADGETISRRVETSDAHPTGLGMFAQAAQLWVAATDLLTAIVSYVRLDDDVFDQILDILADTLAHNDKSRKALEAINADAVWLALYQTGQAEWKQAPALDGVTFAQMERQVAP